jgi:hypothetical protein
MGKREERRPAGSGGPATLGDTLLGFAGPLLQLVPSPPEVARVRIVMSLAAIAWNLPIHVRAGRPDAAASRARLAEGIAELGPRAKEAVADLMIARLTKYGADARTVVVEVRAGGEGEEPVVVSVGEE